MLKSPILTTVTLTLLCVILTSFGESNARRSEGTGGDKKNVDIQRTMVLDGSPVHDVGNLLVHTGNWGAFGSMPGSTMPFSHAPSAEYPAGSGIEYLYVAGLWVAGIKGGVPLVSTAAYQWEFRPTNSPIDVVYYAAEGDRGGTRLPTALADDDRDGKIDEEWLDGRDNDGDGKIDEDFAAISNQMLSCWYTDDQPEALQTYPTHNPMHLLVRQRSYQWSDPDFDDFVCFDYTIINNGPYLLENVYVGLQVDFDAGPPEWDNYYQDDLTGYEYVEGVCTPWGSTDVEYVYVYDADGDGGLTTAQCGVLLLDHTTDPTGETAPRDVRFVTVAQFGGSFSYDEGGEPTNDFERYELMSSQIIERNSVVPRDYRTLVAVGPFKELAPGQSVDFKIALFAANAPDGDNSQVLRNAAAAKLLYRGQRFDLDGNWNTGVGGRETPVTGPAYDVVVDACADPPVVFPYVYPSQVVWTNADCEEEALARTRCGYADTDSLLYMTGIFGKETQINWILPSTSVFVTRFATHFNVDVELTSASAVLDWDILTQGPVMGFRIYRNTSGKPVVVRPSRLGMLPPETRSYRDSGLEMGRSYRYQLVTIMEDGTEAVSGVFETAVLPWTATLHPNFPNPFNPGTTISFTLVSAADVNLSVFTPDGKKVVTLLDKPLMAGRKYVPWDGRDSSGEPVGTGIYLYRLKVGDQTMAGKMALLK